MTSTPSITQSQSPQNTLPLPHGNDLSSQRPNGSHAASNWKEAMTIAPSTTDTIHDDIGAHATNTASEQLSGKMGPGATNTQINFQAMDMVAFLPTQDDDDTGTGVGRAFAFTAFSLAGAGLAAASMRTRRNSMANVLQYAPPRVVPKMPQQFMQLAPTPSIGSMAVGTFGGQAQALQQQQIALQLNTPISNKASSFSPQSQQALWMNQNQDPASGGVSLFNTPFSGMDQPLQGLIQTPSQPPKKTATFQGVLSASPYSRSRLNSQQSGLPMVQNRAYSTVNPETGATKLDLLPLRKAYREHGQPGYALTDADSAKKYSYNFVDGKLINAATGKPASSQDDIQVVGKDKYQGVSMLVWGADGTIYLGSEAELKHHDAFTAWRDDLEGDEKDVLFAGIAVVVDGEIKGVWRQSGHYKLDYGEAYEQHGLLLDYIEKKQKGATDETLYTGGPSEKIYTAAQYRDIIKANDTSVIKSSEERKSRRQFDEQVLQHHVKKLD